MFVLTLQSIYDEVVKCTRQQVGKPYMPYTHGPNTFDSAGLAMFCYQKVGISLPDTPAAQCKLGKAVKTPQPGDLICICMKYMGQCERAKGQPTDLGIFTGDGKQIQALWSIRMPPTYVTEFRFDPKDTDIVGYRHL